MKGEYKTTAVVLHSMPHGERGHIAYLYTREGGRVSYYLFSAKNGVAQVGGNKISLQPLSVIEMIGSTSRSGDMHRMKEAKAAFTAFGIYGDIVKSTVSLYIAEFLYRIVRDKEANPILFDFIIGSIKSLDTMDDISAANFHIYFTLNISRFLGFYPANEYFEGSYFDIPLGRFTLIKPQHMAYINREGSRLMGEFLSVSVDQLSTIKLSREQRRYLLECIVAFFGHHHETFYKIESIKILSEVF